MKNIILIKDLSCDICKKRGKTNKVIFGKKGIICCSNHTENEIKKFRDNKK